MQSRVTVAALALLATAAPAAAQDTLRLPRPDVRLPGAPSDVFSVGSEMGAEWELFSGVMGVAFDDAGNLYILDRDAARVVVVDPRGRLLRQIGRKGAGPGELQFPIGLAVVGDRVIVRDVARQALSVFTTAGEFLHNLPFEQGGMGGGAIAVAGASRVLVPGSQLGRLQPGEPPSVADHLPIFARGLTPADSARLLFRVPAPKPEMTSSSPSSGRVMMRMTPPPTFSPQPLWAALPDGGLAAAWGSGHQVALIGADGRVRAVLAGPLAPRAVTARDKEVARREARETMATGGGGVNVGNVNGQRSFSAAGGLSEEQIEARLREMTFAETIPVIRGLAADREGRLWIRRNGASRDGDAPIDLVTSAGRYIGTVSDVDLPAAFGPGGVAAWIERDELGVERVAVRRLPEAWRPAR